MKNTLTIGQSIDVYEVVNTLYGHTNCYTPIGHQSIGDIHPILQDGISMLPITGGKGCTITMWPDEIKKVGTLIVTKVKPQSDVKI